jgi:hypothetical protein
MNMKNALLILALGAVAATSNAAGFSLTWDGTDGYIADSFYNDGRSQMFNGRSEGDAASLVTANLLKGINYQTDSDGTPGQPAGLEVGHWGNWQDPSGTTLVGSNGQTAAGIGSYYADENYQNKGASDQASILDASFAVAEGYHITDLQVVVDYWNGNEYTSHAGIGWINPDTTWAGLSTDGFTASAQRLDLIDGSSWNGLTATGELNLNVVGAILDNDNEPYRIRIFGNVEKTAEPVPEPASMAVLGLGAAALLRRRKKA